MHPERKLRIINKRIDDTRGFMTQVYDADTGEEIWNIHHIDLHLNANKMNTADVTYYVNGVIEQNTTVEVVDIEVTAIEKIED
jgi:hypothetical protein